MRPQVGREPVHGGSARKEHPINSEANAEVWQSVNRFRLRVNSIAERSLGPVIRELANPRRAWSSSEEAIMAWAAHLWDVERNPALFPRGLRRVLLQRWGSRSICGSE
jgi:hypothetical protein